MKKIDLHIHTLSTISDADFCFDIDILDSYVRTRKIDVIAITNHNLFNLEQYKTISSRLAYITVLPGIEINIGENCGHILVISSSANIQDFSQRCLEVQQKITQQHDYLSLDDFKQIFADLHRYLIIPHYEKKPSVDKRILRDLHDVIYCGEVSSVKKFIYCQKDNDDLTPVLFSDFRACRGNVSFPFQQTFLDIDEISINSIKLCLKDKSKVSLTESEGHSMFFALPDLKLSTGLNVIIGGRSSGKTYTLDQIYETYENIKYIKQFSLLERDPNKAEEEFTSKLNIQQSSIAKDYLSEFSDVVEDVKDISLTDNERKIEKYISSLLKHASECERSDAFSQCSLYAESEFQINDLNKLKDLIQAMEELLDSTQYKSIIEKHISRDILISLYEDLIRTHIYENELVLKKRWINELVSLIQSNLQSNTAATRIEDIDFYEIQINRAKIKKFEKIVNNLRMPRNIYRKELQGFILVAKTNTFNGAQELKNKCGKQVAFSDAFKSYNNPYEYLQKLKDINIEETTYYKYFMDVEFKILNQYGYPVSGGERAEFNLLQEINDALQYDLLLVDEPESSFDNLFLKERVNALLKSISQELPIVVVTHSSTVGASIKPDFMIYTKREITKLGIKYKRYSGVPSNRYLMSNDGETMLNIEATLDSLEAGEKAYKDRSEKYETLRSFEG